MADGLAAQHCAALFPAPPTPETQLEMLARPLKRLGRLLPSVLAPFMGDVAPQVRIDAAKITTSADLIERIGNLAANAVMDDGEGSPALLVSIEAAAILAQLDRAFGGSGLVIEPMPKRFPISADIMIDRIMVAVAGALGTAMRLAATPNVLARHDNLAGIRDSLERESFVIVPIIFGCEGGASHAMTLALSLPLLARVAGKAGPDRAEAGRGQPGPLDEPFAELPLRIDACLIDMRLPLAAIANLRAGAVIPVAVARIVPLTIGSATIARGTVGEVDDRIALRLAPNSSSGPGAPNALQEYRA